MKKGERRGVWLTFCMLAALLGGGYYVSCANGDMFLSLDEARERVQGIESSGADDTGAAGTLTDGALTTERVKTTAPASAGTITLSDGSSTTTYSSLSEAWARIGSSGNYTITLTKGTYQTEHLDYNGAANIKIAGAEKTAYGTDVLIVGQGSDNKQESLRSLIEIRGSGNTVLEYVTLKNTHGEDTGTAQAEVIGHQSSGTIAAYNCSFLSGQDTMRTEGKAWFYKCYIEGDVDFLWMESGSGVVALYESCVIRAIGTRTSKAYFTAPRLAVGSTVGKGLVIYNSTLEAESGLSEVYLGRNPWDKDSDVKNAGKSGYPAFENYYENVAVVGSKYYGAALNEAIWSGSGAHGTENQQFVGFKTDDHFPASSKASTIGSARLTSAQVAAEYGGRNNILNRVYNISQKSFMEDSSLWDIAAVISDNGWEATADTSSTKLDTDSKNTLVTYAFSDQGLLEGSDPTLKNTGFTQNKNYALGNSGAELSFAVVGDCTITVTGYYSGSGTVACGDKSASWSIATQGGTDSAVLELTGITETRTVTVSATAANTYITSISVQYTQDVSDKLAALKEELAQSAGTTETYSFAKASVTEKGAISGTTYTSTDGVITMQNATQNDNHGISTSGPITIKVDGYAKITVGGCAYPNGGGATLTVKDSASTDVASLKLTKVTDGAYEQFFYYPKNDATTLTITMSGADYIHGIKVTNFASFTPVTGVTVSGADSIGANDDSITLSASVLPATATEQSVTWSSSDNNVATVSSGGVVTRKGTGSVTITATANDGSGIKGTKDITVAAAAFKPTSATVTWDLSDASINIQKSLGMLKGSVTGSSDYTVRAVVDATCTDGKLQKSTQGAYSQMNAGTIMSIPVTNGAVVTVVSAGNQGNSTIAGATPTSSTHVYTHNSAAAWIELKATANSTYPKSITITNLDVTALPSAASLSYAWTCAAAQTDAVSIQNSAGIWSEMIVDASSGTFATNNGGWIQCNGPVVLYVPMTKAGKVIISLYNQNTYTVTGGDTSISAQTENAGSETTATSSQKVNAYVYEYNTSNGVAGSSISLSGVTAESTGTYAKVKLEGNGYLGDIIRQY